MFFATALRCNIYSGSFAATQASSDTLENIVPFIGGLD